ncbi:hypothetical protein [Nonomuraea sediminis]|uniref:hypothetical protein n=1 Tax=Nonomuraea sediminis TaxID=2835864 RepID=UPI001BDD9D04|nr:hypothetical protein [Nonomuraea sediminis]
MKQACTDSLTEYLTHWSARTGIAVETWALASLPRGDARAVLETVRLALEHVARAGATTVSVAVTHGGRGLRLTISDNGPGTAATEGVAAMRAAFARIGGTLTVHAYPGEGTTVNGVRGV